MVCLRENIQYYNKNDEKQLLSYLPCMAFPASYSYHKEKAMWEYVSIPLPVTHIQGTVCAEGCKYIVSDECSFFM